MNELCIAMIINVYGSNKRLDPLAGLELFQQLNAAINVLVFWFHSHKNNNNKMSAAVGLILILHDMYL